MRTLTLVAAATLAAVPVAPVVGLLAGSAAAAAPAGCSTVTSNDLQQYFDTSMPALLRELQLPGVVVSVAAGGRTAFARGYGLASVEHGTPMDAARSLVEVGSVTKLFTWTAVMQQVEVGRLDLTADVNTYLTGFQIPDTFPEPVTLLDLMDHTAGFEDFSIGTYGRTAADVPPLGDYLAAHMPARIRPPGQISAYSNFGAALAGYIVSQVSGQPYDQYIHDHVLAPLGMAHSSVSQPLPSDLAVDLADSYDSYAGPARPIAHIFDELPPDGALSTTATDMANFMNAQLHDGRFGDAAILGPATTALMHQQSFAADPRLPGYAHGFQERTINGHRVLMHDGGEEGFRSAMMLVPDCDLGVFLSMNGTSGEDAGAPFTDGFFDRFVPAQAAEVDSETPARTGSLAVVPPQAGFYLSIRHNESTVEKVANLLSTLRLTVATDGTVHFGGKDWLPQGGGLYRAADGSRQFVSLGAPDGHRYLATDGPAYQLVPASQTLPVNLVVLLVVLLPACGILVLPIGWLVRRWTRRPSTATRAWRLARWLAAAAAGLAVAFLVALFLVLINNTDEFLYHVPISFALLLAVPIASLVTGTAALAPTVIGWRGAGLAARIHQVAVFVGLGAFVWFLWQWHLLGWQYA